MIFVGTVEILEGPIRKNTITVLGLVSILQVVSEKTDVKIIDGLDNNLPLSSAGFAWVLPTVLVGVLSMYMVKNNKEEIALKEA